jgi:hypothetical protein
LKSLLLNLQSGSVNRCSGACAWTVPLLLWFSSVLNPSAAQPADQRPAPFLRLRDATLSYHGPEAPGTNLAEIRIGWFGPTNLNDPLAGELWWAARLAVQEANAQTSPAEPRTSDSSDLPFRLVPRWATNPWGTGVSQLTRMIYEEQPVALLGSVDSGATHLAEQVVAKANLPLVSPIVTDKSVTLAGVSWVFACAPSDAAIASVLVDDILAVQADRRGRLALLTCTDHESRMTTKEVIKEFTQRRRLPDFHFEVQPGVQEVARQLFSSSPAPKTPPGWSWPSGSGLPPTNRSHRLFPSPSQETTPAASPTCAVPPA